MCHVSFDSVDTLTTDLISSVCDDDEASSLLLVNVPRGLFVTLYDGHELPNGECDGNDSVTRIHVKRDLAVRAVNTFELAVHDDDVNRCNGYLLNPSAQALKYTVKTWQRNWAFLLLGSDKSR
jgi:hypothetical protein